MQKFQKLKIRNKKSPYSATHGVSIIIHNQDEPDLLKRLLATFFQANTYHPIEIIILTCSSSHPTRIVNPPDIYRDCIRWVEYEHSGSPALIKNLGAKEATFDYLLFLDPGIAFSNDVLARVVSHLNDENIGVVGIRQDNSCPPGAPGKPANTLHTGIKFQYNSSEKLFQPIQLSLQTVTEATYVPSSSYPAVNGAFQLCRKRDFNAIGGFFPGFNSGLEDIDFCLWMFLKLRKTTICINDSSLDFTEHSFKAASPQQETSYCKEDSELLSLRAEHSLGLLLQQMSPESVLLRSAADSTTPGIFSHLSHSESLNVLFVIPNDIGNKTSYQACLYADNLTSCGIDCCFAVPDFITPAYNPTGPTVYCYSQILKNGILFPNGRGPDLIHAWNPREIISQFCRRYLQDHQCSLIIHFDNHEDYLSAKHPGQDFQSLVELDQTKADSSVLPECCYPGHDQGFLENAQGITGFFKTPSPGNHGDLPCMTLLPLVDERIFFPRPLNQSLRKEYGIRDDQIVIAHSGAMDDSGHKEMNELYQAVALLNSLNYHAVLLRCGIDERAADNDLPVTEHVIFPGTITHSQIPDILAAADIFVQPGKGCHNSDARIHSALIEFFSIGRPVILPKQNLGNKVKHGTEGYILEKATAEEIAYAVKEISCNKKLHKKLAEGAIEFYLNHLAVKNSKILGDFYLEILKKKPTTSPIESRITDPSKWSLLIRKLNQRKKLKILFLNDNGYTHGAGIALMRQVEVFHKRGHSVRCFAGMRFKHNTNHTDPGFPAIQYLENLLSNSDQSQKDIEDRIFSILTAFNPDLTITGNFHKVGWQASLLDKINKEGYPVVAYAHDLYWATGGCAYPMYKECQCTLQNCNDEECPKPIDEYPPNEFGDISLQSQQKLKTFGSENPVPLATNSIWSKDQFHRQYKDAQIRIDTIPLPINTDIFRPAEDLNQVRTSLGLDKDKFIILAGSCTLGALGKGNSHLVEIAEKFAGDKNVQFIFFGRNDLIDCDQSNILSVGYVTDVNDLVKYYQASDVFLNPVTIECFGQTMLEALSCGTPVVCFPVCGVTDIAIDGETAICPPLADLKGIEESIHRLINNPDLKNELGNNGRELAVTRFSTKKNYIFWCDYLRKVDFLKRREKILDYRLKAITSRKGSPGNSQPNSGGLRTKGIDRVNSTDSPLITVAIVTLNCVETIEYTILSILDQDYSNIEIVVIDGGSNDGSLDVIKPYEDQIDYWSSSPDKGVYDAMNHALDIASGEFIIFLGTGDTFIQNDVLSIIVRNADLSCDVIHGHAYWQSVTGDEVLLQSQDFSKKFDRMVQGDFSKLWLKGLPPHQATLMKTSLAKRLRFDLDFPVSADWDLMFRAFADGARFFLIDKIVANYPGGGFSARHSDQWILDVMRIVKRYTGDSTAAEKYLLPIYEQNKAQKKQD